MTQINSPFSLPKIRPYKEYSKSQNNHLAQIERIIQQLYTRSGGTNDSINQSGEESTANSVSLSQIAARLHDISKRIEALESDFVVPPQPKTEDDNFDHYHLVASIAKIERKVKDLEAQL